MARLNLALRAALALALAGAAHEGWHLWRANRDNALIAAPERIQVDPATPPALVFAKAYDLARHGDTQEATRLYGALTQTGDAELRTRAYYNLGTLYLGDAARLWNARGVLEYVRVNTLVSAAKENLRAALRLSPGHWDARYNLEYAYRITPPPKEKPKSDFKASKGSVYATMPSLPGGAP